MFHFDVKVDSNGFIEFDGVYNWSLTGEPKMTTVDLEGLSIYYEGRGTGEAIVLAHGIPTDYRAWNAQMDAFQGYRTITYSRRYAAPNNNGGDLNTSTVENNAADLSGLIEKLGISPVNLIGHSYGGFVTAYFAAERPEAVRSLVLVEPAISTLLIEKAESPAQMLSLLLRSPSVATSARKFITGSLNPSLAALDAGQTERATELNVDGVQGRKGAFSSLPDTTRAMMVQNAKTIAELRTKLPPFKDRVGKIKCRTLTINGETSPLWLRRIGELFATSAKGEHATVRGTAHFPHMENPTEFNRLVAEFLSKNHG